MKSLLVAVLLVVSTTLMARPNATSFEKSVAIRQTEQLVKPLDLSKKQTNKILAINQVYAHRNAQLIGQRKWLKSLGYLTPTVEHTFVQALSSRFEARKQAIKAVLNNEQLVAYETMLPELKKDLHKSIRFMLEKSRERYDS